MKRLLPFVLVVTGLLGAAYAYIAGRLASAPWGWAALAIPFVLIWVVPVFYWTRDRDGEESWLDSAAHQASYLSMAWVSFILVLTLARDLALLATAVLPLERAHAVLTQAGVPAVLVASLLAMVLGALNALRGPRVEKVMVRVPGLHSGLDGFRIVQISDLHVGRSIRRAYVERTLGSYAQARLRRAHRRARAEPRAGPRRPYRRHGRWAGRAPRAARRAARRARRRRSRLLRAWQP